MIVGWKLGRGLMPEGRARFLRAKLEEESRRKLPQDMRNRRRPSSA